MTQQPGPIKNISVTPVPALEYVRAWGVPISVICSLSTTVVGIADFLSPKLKLLPPLTFLGMAGVVAVLLARLWLSEGNSGATLKKWLNFSEPFFKAPAFNAAVVATLIFLVGTQVSSANAARNGYLAANSSKIASLQQDIGLLASIDQTTKRVETKLDDANRKLEDIKGVVSGSTPMSDPKMELSRSGMQWSSASFGDAIRRNDAKAVKMFLEGGMPAHQSDGSSPVPPMANVMLLSEQARSAMLRLFAESSVPLGTSWRMKIAGYPEDMCLATTCFGMDMRTCTSFPRVSMWRQLVELDVKLDTACAEVLGANLAELEASNSGESERIQIMRRWGVQNTQSYKQVMLFQKQAAASNAAVAPAQGMPMKSIDHDNPRNFK